MTSTTTSRLQGVVASLGIKAPVRTVTSDNITLSGTQTVNAVSVVTDDRVLVKDQTDGTENGIYNVSTGLWIRAPDFNGVLDAVPGVMVAISEGSGAGLLYRLSTTGDIVVGTTSLSFALMGELSTSAFGQTLVQAIDAAAALVLLNLGSEVQAWDATLDTIAALTGLTDNALIRADGTVGAYQNSGWILDDSDVLTAAGNLLVDTELKDTAETYSNYGNSATGPVALAFTDGHVHRVTATGNFTLSITAPPATGRAGAITIEAVNWGAFTVTLPAAFAWGTGTPPSFTSSGTDVITVYTHDAGAVYKCFVSGLAMA